ncbi:hypothetical protein BIV57_13665 [Mangrovactinospora gilvigrisea]|uniref:Pyridoxamine 5'-phosphate oxidase putative domain-containing protein n=1 Tax=Mangrovactinospora gilvigrisea TaxID=1428644 RepID=A0A1J7BE65_9ACTN|nr:hypothetical protein BIV57_13665 [Mangrovactinospora gilvigrisea]
MVDAVLARALFEEAARKSSLVWARTSADGAARALWHVADGAGGVLVVGGGAGGEQPLFGLDAVSEAWLTVRSKDARARLVTLPVAVERVPSGTAAWDEAVALLKGKRLNAVDLVDGGDGVDGLEARWGRECVVLRMAPVEGAAALDGGDASGAAPPVPSPATTRGRVPRRVGRGRKRFR